MYLCSERGCVKIGTPSFYTIPILAFCKFPVLLIFCIQQVITSAYKFFCHSFPLILRVLIAKKTHYAVFFDFLHIFFRLKAMAKKAKSISTLSFPKCLNRL